MTVFAFVMAAIALGLAGFAAFHVWRSIPVSIALLAAAAVYEIALVVQLVMFASALGDRQVDSVMVISYLVALLVVPVAAMFWGLSDSTRWGPGVVALGYVAVAVMCFRVGQLWLQAPLG